MPCHSIYTLPPYFLCLCMVIYFAFFSCVLAFPVLFGAIARLFSFTYALVCVIRNVYSWFESELQLPSKICGPMRHRREMCIYLSCSEICKWQKFVIFFCHVVWWLPYGWMMMIKSHGEPCRRSLSTKAAELKQILFLFYRNIGSCPFSSFHLYILKVQTEKYMQFLYGTTKLPRTPAATRILYSSLPYLYDHIISTEYEMKHIAH